MGLITNGADDFFLRLVNETVTYRERNDVVRNDFMDQLIKIKNNRSLYEEEKNGPKSTDAKNVANSEPGELVSPLHFYN